MNNRTYNADKRKPVSEKIVYGFFNFWGSEKKNQTSENRPFFPLKFGATGNVRTLLNPVLSSAFDFFRKIVVYGDVDRIISVQS